MLFYGIGYLVFVPLVVFISVLFSCVCFRLHSSPVIECIIDV